MNLSHFYSDKPAFQTLEDIKNKNVLVMGLGLNGGGEATVRFLLKHGANVTITDMKTKEQLASTISSLENDKELDCSKIKYVLGCHNIEDFENADVVIKNPGVKFTGNKYLAVAKQIETDLSIFLHFTKAPIIAVTGSKGKSSTVSAIHYGLTQAGFQTFLGGNITVSPLTFLDKTSEKTPVVLELGGKSPCIVDQTANIALAAKRIVFGKLINSGQTCVAPDYIVCHSSIKEDLIKELIKQIRIQASINPLTNVNYPKIINQKHFERIISLIDSTKCVYGGKYDTSTLKIEPTLLSDVTYEDAVMQEEIFGPILPILTYEHLEELIYQFDNQEKPLALYVFSNNKNHIQQITTQIRYGGGCVNDCIIHLVTTEMGFGGVGESGMGAYHGKVGFETFSHTKSIVDKKNWIDLPMRYHPYQEKYKKLVKIFLK